MKAATIFRGSFAAMLSIVALAYGGIEMVQTARAQPGSAVMACQSCHNCWFGGQRTSPLSNICISCCIPP
jgi:hypothetical protein